MEVACCAEWSPVLAASVIARAHARDARIRVGMARIFSNLKAEGCLDARSTLGDRARALALSRTQLRYKEVKRRPRTLRRAYTPGRGPAGKPALLVQHDSL